MADDTTLIAENEEELKSLLMKVKEESEKAGSKLSIHKIKIMASGAITSWELDGEKWKQWQTSFSWAPKSLRTVAAAMKLKDVYSLEKSYDRSRQSIKKQRHHFADKGPHSQNCGFSSSNIWMWELDYKEGWAPKNWCFCTVVLEKTLESPLDSKDIQPVHPKGNRSWIFIRRTDAKAETPILWPSDAKSRHCKRPDPGKDWGWEERATEDEMVGWCHQLSGH